MTNTNTSKKIAAVIACLAWLALLLQLILIIKNRSMTIPATLLTYLCYFTILTNFVVAACCSSLAFKKEPTNFWCEPTTIAATAVYIAIVGATYNLVLRQLWHPQGWQRLTDELLHAVNPLLFVLFWLFFIDKKTLQWKHASAWLRYPAVYLVLVTIRGLLTGLYPYPFMDLTELSIGIFLRNIGILFLAFLLVSLLFIGIGKLFSKNNTLKV
jgi:hypothetical protein